MVVGQILTPKVLTVVRAAATAARVPAIRDGRQVIRRLLLRHRARQAVFIAVARQITVLAAVVVAARPAFKAAMAQAAQAAQVETELQAR